MRLLIVPRGDNNPLEGDLGPEIIMIGAALAICSQTSNVTKSWTLFFTHPLSRGRKRKPPSVAKLFRLFLATLTFLVFFYSNTLLTRISIRLDWAPIAF